MMEPEIDLDAPQSAEPLPTNVIGDLEKYGPLLVRVAANIEEAVAKGGTFDAPPIHFKIHGRRLTLTETFEVDGGAAATLAP